MIQERGEGEGLANAGLAVVLEAGEGAVVVAGLDVEGDVGDEFRHVGEGRA